MVIHLKFFFVSVFFFVCMEFCCVFLNEYESNFIIVQCWLYICILFCLTMERKIRPAYYASETRPISL